MKTLNQVSLTMTETLRLYLEDLGARNPSAQTISAYRYDIARFLEFLHAKGLKRFTALKPGHITAYIGDCKTQGKSDASINRYYMSIRSFCKFLRRANKIKLDITQDIKPPRYKHKVPKIPSRVEVASIMALTQGDNMNNSRDRAILELLYSSGLRVSELCDLQLLDYMTNSVMVRCGKRGKTRNVPVTDEATAAIDTYVQEFRGYDPGYLFETCKGNRLTRQYVSNMVRRYAKRAGMHQVTTHTLRHACATHLLDEGADLRLIQEVLGHNSISTTQIYMHMSAERMQAKFRQFHPRGKA